MTMSLHKQMASAMKSGRYDDLRWAGFKTLTFFVQGPRPPSVQELQATVMTRKRHLLTRKPLLRRQLVSQNIICRVDTMLSFLAEPPETTKMIDQAVDSDDDEGMPPPKKAPAKKTPGQ